MRESYVLLMAFVGFLLFILVSNLVGIKTDGNDLTFSYEDSATGSAVSPVISSDKTFIQAGAYLIMAVSLAFILSAIVLALKSNKKNR